MIVRYIWWKYSLDMPWTVAVIHIKIRQFYRMNIKNNPLWLDFSAMCADFCIIAYTYHQLLLKYIWKWQDFSVSTNETTSLPSFLSMQKYHAEICTHCWNIDKSHRGGVYFLCSPRALYVCHLYCHLYSQQSTSYNDIVFISYLVPGHSFL